MKGTKRKHRLLSILLSSMLVVSMMPAMGSVAYAAEYTKIGDVSEEVTGTLKYDEPVLGEANPTVKSYLNAKIASPLNKGVSVTNIKWQKRNSEDEKWEYFKGEQFEPGEYRLCGQLRTDKFSDGRYHALATNPTLTINGKSWEIIGTLSDYYAKYGYGYTFHYSETYTVETPAGTQPISIKKEGEGTATASVLAAGYGDTVKLIATPRNGYKFKEWRIDSGGIVMSDATSAENSFTMRANPVVITAVFEELPLTKKGEVEAVTGELEFEEPVLGGANPTAKLYLNARITSPADKGVSFKQIYWQKWNSESEKWESFDGAQFEPGEYRLCGQFRTDKSADRTYYVLTTDATLTINGESWECLGPLSDYYASDGYGYKWHVSKVFEVHGHSFGNWTVVKAATMTEDGILKGSCTCGEVETKAISRISSVKLSASQYAYNGSAKNPLLTVRAADGSILVNNTDYTVSIPSGRKYVGTYTYKVTFKGNYSGTKSVSFKIIPATASVKSIMSGSRKMTVKMTAKPSSKGASAYQIYYKQKGTSTWKKTTTTSYYKTIKSLKKGKYYYVKARAYKKVGTATYYGAWSTTKLSKKIK